MKFGIFLADINSSADGSMVLLGVVKILVTRPMYRDGTTTGPRYILRLLLRLHEVELCISNKQKL